MCVLIALHKRASGFQIMLTQVGTDALQAETTNTRRWVPPAHWRCCYTLTWVLSLIKLYPLTSYIHSFISRLILTQWIPHFLWCNYCLKVQLFLAPHIRKKRELNMRSLKIQLLKGDRSCFVSSRMMWCLWERIRWAKDTLLLGSAFCCVSVKFCAFLKFLGAVLLEMSLFFPFALANPTTFIPFPKPIFSYRLQPKFPFPH